MVKYYLKDTNQEIKIGNKIQVKVPVDTPYGKGTCDIETLVTQTSLEQLCKDGFAEKKQVSEVPAAFHIDDYTPLAEYFSKSEYTHRISWDFLYILRKVSPYAHNWLLLDIISKVMNKDKKFGEHVFIVTSGVNMDVRVKRLLNKNVDLPKFTSFTDAFQATKLIMPFVRNTRYEE